MSNCLGCEFCGEMCWCMKLMIDVLSYAEDETAPTECPLNNNEDEKQDNEVN